MAFTVDARYGVRDVLKDVSQVNLDSAQAVSLPLVGDGIYRELISVRVDLDAITTMQVDPESWGPFVTHNNSSDSPIANIGQSRWTVQAPNLVGSQLILNPTIPVRMRSDDRIYIRWNEIDTSSGTGEPTMDLLCFLYCLRLRDDS